MSANNKTKGIKSAYLFIPTIIIIASLYIITVISTIFVDKYSKEMTAEMNTTTEISDCISDIQASTSKLSETATTFANNPIIGPDLKINETPLSAYVNELTSDTKSLDKIEERINKYELSNDISSLISEAIAKEREMIKVQSHAIYLINSVSYITIPFSYLSKIDNYKLTEREAGFSDEEKLAEAKILLQNRDNTLNINYSANKGVISEDIRDALVKLNDNSNEKIQELSSWLKHSRGVVWLAIALILISNIIFFVLMIKYLIIPIIRFAKRIDDNNKLDEVGSLYEVNHLAGAYNSLLDRHKEFENELRRTAEMDSLTDMPNRYCYNEFLKNVEITNRPACVFLFDINDLKHTNDTYGHLAGDELIKRASLCIKECFFYEEKKNCYRIGGDEFVAIIDGEIDPKEYVNKFNEAMKVHNVSVAIGYANTDDVSKIGYEKLFMIADTEMYKNKGRIKN